MSGYEKLLAPEQYTAKTNGGRCVRNAACGRGIAVEYCGGWCLCHPRSTVDIRGAETDQRCASGLLPIG